MRDINELLEKLENLLEQRAAVQITTAQPESPTVVLYAGRRSMEAQKDIEHTLRRVWRVRADSICHFLLEEESCAPCSGGQAMAPMSREDAIERIEGMFGVKSCFHQQNDLFVVLIQNTDQYRDMEAFIRDYMEADGLADAMNGQARVMKIVLLDETNRNKEMAEQIRLFLREQIRSGTGSNRHTIILSNRLRGGQLLQNQMLRENYMLAGSIILVANGCNEDFDAAYHRMFSWSQRELLTASYARITRPNRNICEVMVNTVLQWIEQYCERKELLSVSDISKRLENNGGTLKLIDDSFKKHIMGNIPSRETLECLPRDTMNMDVIGHLPFEQFDKRTMGSFALFFDQNVRHLCQGEDSEELFRQEFYRFARERFSHREAAGSLSSQNIETVLGEIEATEPPRGLRAYEYLCKRMEMQYCVDMLPVCREVLLQIGRESRDYIEQIRSLVEQFNMNYMLDMEPTVENCYAPLVQRALDHEHQAWIAGRLDGEKLENHEILQMVYDILEKIIGQNPIFSLSLADEMVKRMNSNRSLIQTTIRQQLLEQQSDKIRLRSYLVPKQIMDVLLLDTASDVFDFMLSIYPDMERMNTRNGSVVELLQFFRIGETVI